MRPRVVALFYMNILRKLGDGGLMGMNYLKKVTEDVRELIMQISDDQGPG